MILMMLIVLAGLFAGSMIIGADVAKKLGNLENKVNKLEETVKNITQ